MRLLRGGKAAGLLLCACAANAGETPQTFNVDIPAGPLLACLEQLSQRAGVRIVDTSGRVAESRCAATRGELALDAALRRWLEPLSLAWRRLDDGTIEIVDATRPHMDLSPLTIEDSESPNVARVLEPGAVLAPTVLAENATAVTRIEGDWLRRAPRLGIGQIGRYAPNMYGAGQGLAIRGIERDNDYFTALTVSLDGIDLGTRLLDDDMVLLRDLQRIDLVRGARSFEAGSAAAAGEVRLLSQTPAAEDEFNVGASWGSTGARQIDARWSGPLSSNGFSGSAVLAYRRVPDTVQFEYVPQANGGHRESGNARLRLDYSPDSVPGLQAGFSALEVSAEGIDQLVQPDPAIRPLERGFPRSVFGRVSFARSARLARTLALGMAGFVRYESDGGTLIEWHGNDTAIRKRDRILPQDGQGQVTDEDRRRIGMSVQRQLGDTRAVVGIERTRFLGNLDATWQQYSSPPLSHDTSRLRIHADSAWIWLERPWAQTWQAGLGLRWLRESSADTTSQNAFDHAVSESMLLPLATLQWQPSDDHAFVLSRTAGYRSGGSTFQDLASHDDAYRHYAAERVRTTELAWNAAWSPATHSTLTLFRGEIDHRFTQYLTPEALGVARIAGVELEATHAFSPRWQVRGGLGLLEARNRAGAGGAYDELLAGKRTGSAPPRTAFVGLRYGEERGWFAALDAFHAAAAQSAPYNEAKERRPAYTVADASIGYAAPTWQASLIATNLTDAKYAERFFRPAVNLAGGWRLGEARRVELRADFNW